MFDDDVTLRVSREGSTREGEGGSFALESTGFRVGGGREDSSETVERSPCVRIAVDWVVGDGKPEELEMDLRRQTTVSAGSSRAREDSP